MKKIYCWLLGLLALITVPTIPGKHVDAKITKHEKPVIKEITQTTPLILQHANTLFTVDKAIQQMSQHQSHWSHYSHGSHYSHYSHQSHQSHYSHYSGY
ncbi:MAG TPA: hypothetical protein EYP21_06510 [Syntrophaceae bacterium]|nr:hypothetical protein [Syntrophaceae bacterium]